MEEKKCLEVEEMALKHPLPKSKDCMMTRTVEVDKLSSEINGAHKDPGGQCILEEERS